MATLVYICDHWVAATTWMHWNSCNQQLDMTKAWHLQCHDFVGSWWCAMLHALGAGSGRAGRMGSHRKMGTSTAAPDIFRCRVSSARRVPSSKSYARRGWHYSSGQRGICPSFGRIRWPKNGVHLQETNVSRLGAPSLNEPSYRRKDSTSELEHEAIDLQIFSSASSQPGVH